MGSGGGAFGRRLPFVPGRAAVNLSDHPRADGVGPKRATADEDAIHRALPA